jgi:hypothetical protein
VKVLQITQAFVSTQQCNNLKVSVTFFFHFHKQVDVNVSKDANWLKIWSSGELYADDKFLFSWVVCIIVGLSKSILGLAKVLIFS